MRDFLIGPVCRLRGAPTLACLRDFVECRGPHLPAAELAARRRATRGSAATAGTLVLVTEDEPALFQIVGRHLDRHPIASQRLDPVLFHLAGGVWHDFLSRISLPSITCIAEE